MPTVKRREAERLLREMNWQNSGCLWWNKDLTGGLCNFRAAVDLSNGWLREQDCPTINI